MVVHPEIWKSKLETLHSKLKTDIETQLSDILLMAKNDTREGEGGRQKALLHQALREATKNASELLEKIIISSRAKEGCPSDTDMAASVVGLSILITKCEYYYFSQLTPTVSSLVDKKAAAAATKSLFTELSCLQALLLLLQRKPSGTATATGAAIKILETEITEFSLKVEADIEMQLSNILLAEDVTKKAKASQQLIHQTLREAAQNAIQLLKKRITTQKEDSSSSSSSSCVSGGDMAAIAALTTLITTIEYYFFKPFSPLSSCRNWQPLKSFIANLSSLQAFLQKESCSGALKDLQIQIRDFALKAERFIEWGMTQYVELLGTDYNAHEELDQDLEEVLWNSHEELYQALEEAAKNAAELLEIINSASNNDAGKDEEEAIQTQSWILHWSKPDNSEFDVNNNAKKLVGREHDYELLITKLRHQMYYYYSSRLQLILIVGMPGIGKTSLARIIYIDKDVEKDFDVRCWITMPTKTYNETQMLHSLLASITPEAEPNEEIKKGSTPYQLAQQVRKRLEGKRFLIVLDNFWNNKAWNIIKTCFPDDNGSRILLTTTHFDRDSYVHTSYDIHNMTLLDSDKSWDLFCNTLSIKGHMEAKFIEEIRRDVVEKCDGLPQSIIAVAKRLSKCTNIKQEWKKIEKELESLGILDRSAFIPSYNQLPQHLKVCFLYLGVFPKRYQIRAKMLIRLWIAEGFVKPLENEELETQAYGYLQELIDRSLLLIGNQSFDSKIKTCRLHSAFHSFCVVEAQKEGILCAVNTQKHSGLPLKVFANSCRWLSFYSHGFDYYVLFRTNITRSMFIFNENPEMFVHLKLLRVLAFDTSIFLQRVPLHLGHLVYLRYLSITQWFEGMDDVVSNNPNLQTLVVSNNNVSQFGAATKHLPSSIWKAPRLRHLELGNTCMVDPPSMVNGNLESLSWVVRPIHCRKVYDKLPNVKKLKIFLKDDDIEASHSRRSCSNPIVLDYLGYLEELEKLTISVSVGCAVTLPKRSVFPSELIELKFNSRNLFNTLTERSMFPLHLKKLRLSGTNLSNRDLKVIGMLPRLEVLKLENAFHGAVWKLSKRGFPRLRLLSLEAKKLKCWKAIGRYHFSELQHLILRFCNRLRDIPPVADICSLKSIELEESRSSLITSAKRIQEVQQERGYHSVLELKIRGPVYDESQGTDTNTDVPEEEELQSTDTDTCV